MSRIKDRNSENIIEGNGREICEWWWIEKKEKGKKIREKRGKDNTKTWYL